MKSPTPKTSRQKLLEYIQSQRVVAVMDLSRALQMTPANARHHLTILEAEGLVQVVGQRPAKGKGRPALLYGLSGQALGHNLDGLSAALLQGWQAWFAGLPPEEQEPILNMAAAMLPGEGPAPGVTPGNPNEARLPQRMYQAVQRLNGLSYQARWEAHASGPRLILGHCPYAPVAENHPVVCRLDAVFLAQLTGAPVEQLARLVEDLRGGRQCIFRVQ